MVGWIRFRWLVLVAACLPGWGNAAVEIALDTVSVDVGHALRYLPEPTRDLTIEDVSSPPLKDRFQLNRSAVHRDDSDVTTVWIRLDLSLPPGADHRYLLVLAYTQIDRIDMFYRGGNGNWITRSAGDRLAFDQRRFRYPHPVFELPDRGGPFEIYLRLQTDGSLQTPFEVWREDAFIEYASQAQLALGFYFAFLAAMVLYNAFLYAVVRDRSYLYYVIYLGGMLLLQATLEGHAGLYLWPQLPAWNDVAAVSLLGFTLSGGLLFVREMANTRDYAPRLARTLLALAAVALLPVAGVWISYGVSLLASLLIALLGLLLLPWPIVVALRRRYRPAWYLVLGYGVLVPGGLLLVLHYLGVIAPGIGVRHALQVGTAVEAMLLSFALADRIKLLREQRDSAQRRAIAVQRKALAQQEAFSRRLLEVQDAERRRVALELHDGFGQMLAVALGRLKRWQRQPGSPSSGEIGQMTEQATDMLGQVRDLAHTLHPHHLDRLGLSAALRAVGEQVERSDSLTVTAEIDEIDLTVVAADVPLHLYRIAQEAISNVQRHADARRIRIGLAAHGERVQLVIADDGRGFDHGLAGDGLGLAGMRERAGTIGAELELESGDAGTVVRVRVPFASVA